VGRGEWPALSRQGGVTADDVFQNFYGYGLFTGGLGAISELRLLVATVIPMSGGLTRRQVMMMEDLGATVIGAGTPSYTLVVAEVATEEGIDLRSRMNVRVGFFGAEPWTEECVVRSKNASAWRPSIFMG